MKKRYNFNEKKDLTHSEYVYLTKNSRKYFNSYKSWKPSDDLKLLKLAKELGVEAIEKELKRIKDDIETRLNFLTRKKESRVDLLEKLADESKKSRVKKSPKTKRNDLIHGANDEYGIEITTEKSNKKLPSMDELLGIKKKKNPDDRDEWKSMSFGKKRMK